MHVERAGDGGPMLLLVHGSLAPGWGTWAAQRELAETHRLAVVHRSGYPPNPPLPRIDFDEQAAELAALLTPETHLVGHSYGGVISLIAAARAAHRVRSLTVIEPPAWGLAAGVAAVEEARERTLAPFAEPSLAPRDFLRRFAAAVGSSMTIPDRLPPALEASVRATMVERPPGEAIIPISDLRAAGVPMLVVSGAHSAAFDAVCDVLVEALGAERAVIAGGAHSVQRTGRPFNDRLAAFVGRAEAAA